MTDLTPTDGELAILQVLWANGAPATVHDVHAALLESKDTAYTTVLKMLSIMHEKGLVSRDTSERKHRYSALYSEPAVQTSMFRNLVHTAFAGSAAKLVQRALDDDAATVEELDAMEKMIAAAKRRRAAE